MIFIDYIVPPTVFLEYSRTRLDTETRRNPRSLENVIWLRNGWIQRPFDYQIKYDWCKFLKKFNLFNKALKKYNIYSKNKDLAFTQSVGEYIASKNADNNSYLYFTLQQKEMAITKGVFSLYHHILADDVQIVKNILAKHFKNKYKWDMSYEKLIYILLPKKQGD